MKKYLIDNELVEYLDHIQYKHCEKCWKECTFFCEIASEAWDNKNAKQQQDIIDDYKKRLNERGHLYGFKK